MKTYVPILMLFLSNLLNSKDLDRPDIQVRYDMEKDFPGLMDQRGVKYFLINKNKTVELLYMHSVISAYPDEVNNLICALSCGDDRMALVVWEGDRSSTDSAIYLVIVKKRKIHPRLELNSWILVKKQLLSHEASVNMTTESDVKSLSYDGKNTLSYKLMKYRKEFARDGSSSYVQVPVGEERVRTILIEE